VVIIAQGDLFKSTKTNPREQSKQVIDRATLCEYWHQGFCVSKVELVSPVNESSLRSVEILSGPMLGTIC